MPLILFFCRVITRCLWRSFYTYNAPYEPFNRGCYFSSSLPGLRQRLEWLVQMYWKSIKGCSVFSRSTSLPVWRLQLKSARNTPTPNIHKCCQHSSPPNPSLSSPLSSLLPHSPLSFSLHHSPTLSVTDNTFQITRV